MNAELMESNFQVKCEQLAEGYRKKYPTYVSALEKSVLNRACGVNEYHITQLGKQLDSFSDLKNMLEANGSLNNLGILPKVAFDVITAVMGQSVLSAMASVQAIESQKGIVHFKNVRAVNSKGNLSSGERIIDPIKGTKTPSGYASNRVLNEIAGVGDGLAVSFAHTLSQLPSRSQFLSISVDGDPLTVGADQGVKGSNYDIGSIWGSGVSGTINYETGALALTFASPVANTANIRVSYQQNLEKAQDIAKIESFFDSKEIEARAYALKSTVGLMQQFTLQKMYGDSAMDEMTKDLVRAVNMEVFGDLLSKLLTSAQGTTSFSKTPASGVSPWENKMSYVDKMYEADSTIVGNAGRGQISVMIVGREHAALAASIPSFEKISDGRSLGAHIFGKLNDVLYIRVPEDALMGGDAKRGVGIFKGDSPFDSACVYAPFMPLTMTGLIPELPNPLVSQNAAATMAGVEVLVPQYATNFNVTV